MKNNLPTRKNIRLKEYNYSQEGYYFITICTKDRKNILSNVVGMVTLGDPKIKLTQVGNVIEKNIKITNEIYADVKISDYVIMPNHIHMICVIEYKNGSSRAPTPTNAKIPQLISMLKRMTNKECNMKIWQRNYYEHVIRNEKEYLKIKEYIINNPINWEQDIYF